MPTGGVFTETQRAENLAQPVACAHCGALVPHDAQHARYCCAGCEAVAGLLAERGLSHYYDLAAGQLAPVGAAPTARSHSWLQPIVDGAEGDAAEGETPEGETPSSRVCTAELDAQGIHCAACVWLMNETFGRRAGGVGIIVNPALGKLRLSWRRGTFDLADWVREVERFGYQFGPSRKTASPASSNLTWRLGVCIALAMNVMLFSLSFYFGLSRADGDIYRLFSRLSLVLSSAVVVVGGWPFFRAAALGVRRRVLHLDLPIALGIALVYGTSLVQVARGRGGELTYFDTLNTFITLMLVGRFLQERVLSRNRQYLLTDDGAEGIFVRRIEDGKLNAVRAPALRKGDRLLVTPGELVPIDGVLESDEARLSTDWITGESAPRALKRGERLPAGSFNAGEATLTLLAETDFADSPLVSLLRQPTSRAVSEVPHRAFWDRLARRWVVGVLVIAAVGFTAWLPHGMGAALDVAVSLLVVTCPCAIGIALPLGYELVQAHLRGVGFFARASDLLDRLERVRQVIFDKTGTLTLGRLELVDPEQTLSALDSESRDIAYNLACRSSHPASLCVARALARQGAAYDQSLITREIMGQGVVGRKVDVEWRLGRATWAQSPGDAAASGTVLSRNGVAIATFAFREALRAGAADELRALAADGYRLWLVSGDAPARALALGNALGIPAERVRGGRSPQDKAIDVAEIGGADALYLGDGVNDALAFEQSLAAGTVAIERPVLPGRSDFFMVGETLAPLGQALSAARRLRVVARRVLAISVGYNVFAVTSCLLGVMTPVRAAISMPLSSLGILLFTIASLKRVQKTRRRASAQTLAATPAALAPGGAR